MSTLISNYEEGNLPILSVSSPVRKPKTQRKPTNRQKAASKQAKPAVKTKQNREVYNEKRRNKLKAAKDAGKIQALERELVQSNLRLEIALNTKEAMEHDNSTPAALDVPSNPNNPMSGAMQQLEEVGAFLKRAQELNLVPQPGFTIEQLGSLKGLFKD